MLAILYLCHHIIFINNDIINIFVVQVFQFVHNLYFSLHFQQVNFHKLLITIDF